MLHTVYLGLGSNLGNSTEMLNTAQQLIERKVGHIQSASSHYCTEPWGFSSDNDFLNAVVCCLTKLTPRQLLQVTQRIERRMGRTHKSTDGEYHDRLIDIDILLYDNLVIDEPDLKIPHPQMRMRPFVMEPLREVMGFELPQAWWSSLQPASSRTPT